MQTQNIQLRSFRPPCSRPRRPPKAVRELVDALLTPLVNAYPLAEIFWEARHRSIIERDASGRRTCTQEWVCGAQLRVVGERVSAVSWTTDLTAQGLLRAFAGLGLRLNAPRLPDRVRQLTLKLDDAATLQLRQVAAAELTTRAARRLSDTARVRVEMDEYLRGSATALGRSRQWRGRQALVSIELPRPDGSLLRRARVLEGTCGPEALRASGLLADVRTAWAQAPHPAGELAGRMPVVVAPGFGAILFHELVGHSLEADHVLGGASPFAHCTYGQQVSHPELTIVDSPQPEVGCGGLFVDDEGQTPVTVTLIDAGTIAGMLHDRVTATMVGAPSTGNGRREDFRMEPQPRMRNLVVAPGPHSPDALRSDIRRGLYIERLAEGRADLASGCFTLTVEAGRRIQRGHLGAPVRGVLVRGNIRATLAGIEGVGNDWQAAPDPVFCGKRGTVITGVAGPTVRLGELEVLS